MDLAKLTTSGVSGLTVDRGSAGPFDVYAASQVGLQHARNGHTREDAYALGAAEEHGWVFAAVADGLGSAENSHAAAQLAARTAVQLMHRYVPPLDPSTIDTDWTALAQAMSKHIAGVLSAKRVADHARHLSYISAKPESTKISPSACTLAFAALGPAAADGYLLLWGSIGDSDLLLVHLDSGHQSWLTQNETKQRGGMVNNATRALPRDYTHLQVGYRVVPADTMTVLATDGMADAIRLEPEQYAAVLPQVAGPRPKEWMFGELVGFDLPGLHDDRTLVAAWARQTDSGAMRQGGPH